MVVSMTEVQKEFDNIQKNYQQLEVDKSKAQETVYDCMLKQQKLTTRLNELLGEVNLQKNNLNGIALPNDFKLKPKGPLAN